MILLTIYSGVNYPPNKKNRCYSCTRISAFLHSLPRWFTPAWWGHITSDNLVNTGPGNDLLPEGIKPLPEAILANLNSSYWHSNTGISYFNIWYIPELCLRSTQLKSQAYLLVDNELMQVCGMHKHLVRVDERLDLCNIRGVLMFRVYRVHTRWFVCTVSTNTIISNYFRVNIRGCILNFD